ncbi:hypothetical protein IFM89_015586 [Coptis chinensis]|uniref:Uncharacterized protein n=1 Tax=Coptis chinensis TaxID=261450 RepID=A0A835I127_9MAGN|nr:hypothetical protein IFM89_015586 [Coptis chinensis]
MPNIVIRTAILEILTNYSIDLEKFDRMEQLKKSGMDRVIIGQNLVNKWNRPIFNNNMTRYVDVRKEDEERVVYSRPSKGLKGPARLEYKEVDLDVSQFLERDRPRLLSSMQHAVRPESMVMDFVESPLSKIDPAEVRARAGQIVSDQRRLRLSKNLHNLKS